MKITICISQLAKGGAERVVSNLANYLRKENEVSIISLKNIQPEYQFRKDIKIFMLDDFKKKNKFQKIYCRLKRLKKVIMNENPDVVLCFLPEPSFLVLFLKTFLKIKVIISVRNDPKVEYKNIVYRIIMKILYPKADGFVFQTQDAQQYFSYKIINKSVIIYNSLNPEFMIKPYNGKRKKEIVSVGRFFPQKNHMMLIDAFFEFHKFFEDYKLYIYGDGPLRNILENKIKELHLEEFIFLPGIIDNVKERIHDASIFVLSSNYEGMPNSLMEAMALGLPCISTDCPCGGPRVLIEDEKNGILVNVGDSKMLFEKMKYLVENEDLLCKLSYNANKSMDRFDPEIINKKWEDYIISVKNKD